MNNQINKIIKIGRATFINENNNLKKIIKHQPPIGKSIFHKFSRKMFKGSLPFKNEMRVISALKKYNFLHFKFPANIIDESKKIIEYEFINGYESRKFKNIEKIKIIDSLIEFSSIEITSGPLLEGLAFKLIESPWIRSLRAIIQSKSKFSIKLKALIIVIKFLFNKKTGKPVFIHNDLQCKNIIRHNDGHIYLIDFEDAIFESRLQLIDVVNVLFDEEKNYLNKELLLKYWSEAVSLGDNKNETKHIFNQVRVCLLRNLFAPCRNCAHQKDLSMIEVAREEMLSILLDNSRYRKWWNSL